MLDPARFVAALEGTLGLPFSGRLVEADRIEIQLADGTEPSRTFAILVQLNGRRLTSRFRPGSWAGDLVRVMGEADEGARRMWCDLVAECVSESRGLVAMSVGGRAVDPLRPETWPADWRLLDLSFERAPVAVDQYDVGEMGLDRPEEWVAKFGAAVAALLPLEEIEVRQFEPEIEGDPVLVTHFRYERSRRNRAAAIAIHGYDCRACSANMEKVYGPLGVGFIHVHHETSLASQGGAREVDPYTELAPLCPNCHGIAHRRSPPFSVAEIRAALEQRNSQRGCDRDDEPLRGSSRPT